MANNGITHHVPSHTIPYDVLVVIVGCCSRHALLDLCLVGKAFKTAAIAQLYKNPYTFLDDGCDDPPAGSEGLGQRISVQKYVPSRWTSFRRHIVEVVQAEEIVLSRLRNLKEAVFKRGDPAQVERPTKYCASVNIRSVKLPAELNGLVEEPFWAWVENQKEIQDLTLPWRCNPSGLCPLALPKLEKLGAHPAAAKRLVRNRSIRSYDGITTPISATEPHMEFG
ncbi:hypothetical protein FRB96_007354 [Tulasnella sp. 330]|nr:hypothetical protein FRB96_007354 [Tulasnella sp. 330]